jgi:hypothetical protein
MPWLIVVGNVKALQWILNEGSMGFRSHVRTEAMHVGDRFAIYTSKGAYGNPARDESQILALGHIASPVSTRSVRVGDEQFAKSCSISIDRALPLNKGVIFRNLVPEMDFLMRDFRRWPGAVHKTLVKVSTDDFARIESAFDRVADNG